MAEPVDFYKLTRVVQDRFVQSAGSAFAPRPLAFRPGGPPSTYLWVALTAACVVLLLALWTIGFGDLGSSAAIHGVFVVLAYVLVVFGAAYGVVSFLAHKGRERRFPYRVGVYVFPLCVVDARTKRLLVHPIGDVSSIEQRGDAVHLTVAGDALVLPSAPGAARAILEAKAEAPGVLERGDPNEIIELDPLHNPRFSSPVGPQDSYRETTPGWARLTWAIPLALAVVLGPATWAIRNSISDGRMYARAEAANDVDSYTAYLVRGYRRADEVRSTRLPRAELQIAIAAGTPDALLAFREEHPRSNIGDEVDIALRSAMLAELERAKAKQTKAALDEFARKYPTHGIGPELSAAVHAVYARALDAYKAKAAPASGKERSVLPTIERLFAYAEKEGGKVEIRFRRRPLRSLHQADDFIAKTPSYTGEISHPSRHFDAKKQGRREEALTKDLAEAFRGIAPELLVFTKGEEVGDAKTFSIPTLLITHGPDWSTHSYESENPRGTYVGLYFIYEVELVVPGDPEPFKWAPPQLFRHAALSVLRENEQGNEDKVYEEMNRTATQIFQGKLLGLFFADSKRK